ncbi:MAG: lipoate--protein ligase family protein [Deltaproteobacteria bacterium]|nr:MAG: lipoate--protein ligase family protein [Deltaproteobacteria bacterium]
MELYDLGKMPWHESQLIYHALANLGRESLVLVSPSTPYVCIGYHQDVSHEVDVDFCQCHGVPIFRREVGGGAVYLDGDQLFVQLILRQGNPSVPLRKEAFYRKFLQPIINVYHRVGIPAEYKPVNDVVVKSRKISGSGVGEIGECIAFVGNLILDFDYRMMSRILKVPDEKFRDKVQKSIADNLTTIRRELGDSEAAHWNEARLNGLLVEEFEKLLGSFVPRQKDTKLQAKVEELGSRMLSNTWLHRQGRRAHCRRIKVRSEVTVKHKMHKAPGGLIRADFEIRDGKFANVSISGDFFCYPEDAITQLESGLEGRKTAEIYSILEGFYGGQDIEIPGITIDDWMKALEA